MVSNSFIYYMLAFAIGWFTHLHVEIETLAIANSKIILELFLKGLLPFEKIAQTQL